MKFRLIGAILAIAATVTAISGCGGDSKVNNQEKGGKLSMLIHSHDTWPYDENWWIWDKLEEKTGIEFEHTPVANSNFDEKLNILVASGGAPDLFEIGVHEANKLGMMGALKSIDELAEGMDNFNKYADEHEDILRQLIAEDGRIFVYPTHGYTPGGIVWLYRKDVFDKHGISIPKTSEELYTVLKKLKELYPASYPLTFRSYQSRMKVLLFGWDTGRDYYYDHDEKMWKFAPLDPGYKEAMQFMNKLYTEGLIPPDFMTISTENWNSMISTDNAFVTIDYVSRIDEFNNVMRETNPEFTLAHLPPVAGGTYGSQLVCNDTLNTSSLSVYSNTKNEDVVKRFIDYLYTDEAIELVSWGEEGVTYEVVDGNKKFKDVKTNAELCKKYGINTAGVGIVKDTDSSIALYSDELQSAIAEAGEYRTPFDPRPLYTQEEYDNILGKYSQPLVKYVNEQSAHFILGNRSFDEWDSYTEDIKKNYHVDEIMNFYNEGTKRFYTTEIVR